MTKVFVAKNLKKDGQPFKCDSVWKQGYSADNPNHRLFQEGSTVDVAGMKNVEIDSQTLHWRSANSHLGEIRVVSRLLVPSARVRVCTRSYVLDGTIVRCLGRERYLVRLKEGALFGFGAAEERIIHGSYLMPSYSWVKVDDITRVVLPEKKKRATVKVPVHTIRGVTYRMCKSGKYPWVQSNSKALKQGLINEFGVPNHWCVPTQHAESLQCPRAFRTILQYTASKDFKACVLVNKFFHRQIMDVTFLKFLWAERKPKKDTMEKLMDLEERSNRIVRVASSLSEKQRNKMILSLCDPYDMTIYSRSADKRRKNRDDIIARYDRLPRECRRLRDDLYGLPLPKKVRPE